MSGFDVVPADLTAASEAVLQAATDARTAHGAAHLNDAAAAMPESTSASTLTAMAPEWQADIEAWSDAAEAFAASLGDQSNDFSSTDEHVEEQLGGAGGGDN